MHKMGDVGEGLQCDFGAIEGTPTGDAARLQLLGASILALDVRLARIPGAARFVKDVLYGPGKRSHGVSFGDVKTFAQTKRMARRKTRDPRHSAAVPADDEAGRSPQRMMSKL
ncbi:hypothetical protein ACVWZ6_002344 [Bradyrhizobium sp. GM6.1]